MTTDTPLKVAIDTPHIDKAINRLTHPYEGACSDFDLAQAFEEIREFLNKLATSK